VILFYFDPTLNPTKIAFFFEETNLGHRLIPVGTSDGKKHVPVFRRINPNRKVLAIVGSSGARGQNSAAIDSTAFLLYLVKKRQSFLGRLVAKENSHQPRAAAKATNRKRPFISMFLHSGFSRIWSDPERFTYRRPIERVSWHLA
jgi:glutathione S-transferase